MEKKTLMIGTVVLAILVIGAVYIYSTKQPQTYDECVQQILKDVQKYKLASEEPVGAKRTDDKGNIWIKSEDGIWKTNASGFENTGWGDIMIDEQKGGAKYAPQKYFPECEKYVSRPNITPNTEMEKKFTEIINQVIQEQSQKGITISVKEIQVLNLVGKVQGFINLNCENIDNESERAIIGSIANKLFEEYPNDFIEGSERDSWVDVYCAYKMGWRISDGDFGIMY